MGDFAAYGHALVSLAGVALIALILAPLSAARKAKEGIVTGGQPEGGYGSLTYRLWRAHLNTTENIGIFASVTIAAMLAGVSPLLVNWLASLYLLSRLAHTFIYIRGIGAQNFGPRTFVFVFGWLICALLALATIWRVFF